jgi:hypothetical protein
VGSGDHQAPLAPQFVPAGFVQSPDGALIPIYQPNAIPHYVADHQHAHAMGLPEFMGWRAGLPPPPPGYPMTQPVPLPLQPPDLQSNQGQVQALQPTIPWTSCPPPMNIAPPSTPSHAHYPSLHGPTPSTSTKNARGQAGGAQGHDDGRAFQHEGMIHTEGHKRLNTGFHRRGGRGGYQHSRHHGPRAGCSSGPSGGSFHYTANHGPKY